MSRTGIKPRLYLKLLMLSALLGLISAMIAFAFLGLVRVGLFLVWKRVAQAVGLQAPVFTLVVCTLGGLLVGVLVRIFGDHSGVFAKIMTEFGRTCRFHYRRAPGMVITALASLIAGGSLGPEAPPADAAALERGVSCGNTDKSGTGLSPITMPQANSPSTRVKRTRIASRSCLDPHRNNSPYLDQSWRTEPHSSAGLLSRLTIGRHSTC